MLLDRTTDSRRLPVPGEQSHGNDICATVLYACFYQFICQHLYAIFNSSPKFTVNSQTLTCLYLLTDRCVHIPNPYVCDFSGISLIFYRSALLQFAFSNGLAYQLSVQSYVRFRLQQFAVGLQMCVTILRAYLRTTFIVLPCFKPLNLWGGKQSVNLITTKSCDSAYCDSVG